MFKKEVLFVGHKYDSNSNKYGLIYNAYYKTLKKLKDCEAFFYEEFDKKSRDSQLLKLVNELNPKIIFFVYQVDQLNPQTLILLKKTKSLIVNFYGDDCWRFESFTLKTYNFFDVIISADETNILKYNNYGIKNVIFSQWAGLSDRISNKVNKDFKYDVSFIGGYNEYRGWIIRLLEKEGIKVQCFGKGWKNGIIGENQMKNIIEGSRINLDLSNSISYDIRFLAKYPIGFYRLLKSIFFKRNFKYNDGIKARIFEVTSMGGLLLTNFTPAITNYFDVGKEIYCYNNTYNLVKTIKLILSNQLNDSSVRKLGHKKSIENHLYENRIKSIFEQLQNFKK